MNTVVLAAVLVVVLVIAAIVGVVMYERLAGKEIKNLETTIWYDRSRKIFGIPCSFTKYFLSDTRLFIQKGFMNIEEDQVMLYRVLDITLKMSLYQRLFSMGTIKIVSSDKSLNNFELKNIKRPREVKEKLSELVEQQRDLKRVTGRELMVDVEDIDNSIN
jgi:uncharacterized membrane protein YdbT with pleckstrin-like domain